MTKRTHKTQAMVNLSLWVDDNLTVAEADQVAQGWVDETIQCYLLAMEPVEEYISHKTVIDKQGKA